MVKQLFFEDVKIGMNLPVQKQKITSQQLVMYAGASGDYYQIHYDQDYAKSNDLPGIIIHGALKNALLGKLITDWIGDNGDLLELIPPHYKINQRGQDIPPEEQYLEFSRLVAPIKDKCLFIRGGNHDYIRSFNILDFDVCKVLAKEIGVPYYRMPGYTRINVDGSSYNLVSGHGKSGGKNGDLELDKMAAVYSQGDVFFLGHNHQLYVKPMDSLIIGDDNTEEMKRRWYIRGGSFLRYADYARYSFFPIIRTGWTTIEFKEEGIHCWEN